MFIVQCTTLQLEALKGALSDAGSVITGSNDIPGRYKINGNGIVAEWEHNGTDTLWVGVKRKPVFVSEEYIRNRLIDNINEQKKDTTT